WTKVHDYVTATTDDLKGLAAIITERIAENEKLAADAAGRIEQDRTKVAKLTAGEDVDVGEEIDFREELLKAGLTESRLTELRAAACRGRCWRHHDQRPS